MLEMWISASFEKSIKLGVTRKSTYKIHDIYFEVTAQFHLRYFALP